jgi:putative NIF3 family GTP cyclohydrolase 1 type 2
VTADIENVSKSVVKPIANPPPGFEGAGYGMKAQFLNPVSITQILRNVGSRLGLHGRVMVAKPSGLALKDSFTVSSVAVCAGSGYDVLKDCDADVIVTGEMTHHHALRMVQLGKVVMTVFHSNSERDFLHFQLQPILAVELMSKVPGVRVLVSEEDRDPFSIIDVERDLS